MFAWLGQVLRVDLTAGTATKERLDPEVAKTYLGTRALGTFLLRKEVPGAVDPSGISNKLVFVTGPLTGTLAPNGGQIAVVTRGADGKVVSASLGGDFGPELKFAGFDAIIVQGKADKPVYLWIKDQTVEIRPAGDLWGKSVTATLEGAAAETDKKAKVACIGPAGENKVPFAVIATGKTIVAGGNGIGAAMGAKNLKAIAVRGILGFRIAQPKNFIDASVEMRQAVNAAPFVCSGSTAGGGIMLRAESVAQGEGGEGARARSCFGCACSFSDFSIAEGVNVGLSAPSIPEAIDGRLADFRLITDFGLDYAVTKSALASAKANPEEVRALATGARSLNGGVVALPAQRSGCTINGYVLTADMKPGTDAKARALAAVVESAGMCGFAAAACDAETVAKVMSTATGIAYSAEDILRTGERINESA